MIRPAHPNDAAPLAALWNPWIRDTLVTFNPTEKSPADVAALIGDRTAAGHAFLVAEDSGTLLGFATYGQFRGGLGYVRSMEHTIILTPAAHGKGIARALLTAAEDHARSAGAHQMIGGVTGENLTGRDFHLAMGYRLVGTVPQAGYKFGRYIDLLLMQKILT